jgi:hypothetical protein
VGVLVEAALFLAIVGFAWPTRGGRQCWKTGFPAGGTQSTFAQPNAQGEGMKSGKWGQAQLGFHKCTHQPTIQASALSFYRVSFPFYIFAL